MFTDKIPFSLAVFFTFGLVATSPRSKAEAQAGFSSRDAFLAADSSAVRTKLGAVGLVDSIALDSIVRADIPAVSAFFSLSSDVFWADGQGSSAHPTAGIALDRQRLAAMRSELGASGFGDVVLFILAHEYAHMGQFRHYSKESVREVARIKSFECQADLWAGAMMINLLIDSTMIKFGAKPERSLVAKAVDEEYRRIEQAVALAYQIGSPAWDDASTHPPPAGRMGCVARGIVGGLQMRLIRDYERTHAAEELANIRNNRLSDPRLPDLGTDFWTWTDTEAKAVMDHDKTIFKGPKDGRHFLDVFRALAESAEAGAERFRAEASSGIPDMDCSTADDSIGVSMTCRDSLSLSAKMQSNRYDLYRNMVLGVVIPRGWSEQPEKSVNGGESRSASFVYQDGRVSATIAYEKSDARYKSVLISVLVRK